MCDFCILQKSLTCFSYANNALVLPFFYVFESIWDGDLRGKKEQFVFIVIDILRYKYGLDYGQMYRPCKFLNP